MQDWSEKKYKLVGRKLAKEMQEILDNEMYRSDKWYRRWTKYELDTLKQKYPIMEQRVLASLLKRTDVSVKSMAHKLKLRKKSTVVL